MFQTIIDQIVKVELTNEPIHNEWHNGTLFVSTISPAQAQQVQDRLNRVLGEGSVEMSPIGNTGEYAFDFVVVPDTQYI